MGNHDLADAQARVRIFASSTSWIEGNAVRQLHTLAARPGMRAVAGMPDLHHGPVGCAALVEGIVYPDIIGTDIGCGMQVWVLDLPEHRLRADKAASRLVALEGAWSGDSAALLAEHGIDGAGFAGSLGTIGGGNHFCEVQAVADVLDATVAEQAGLRIGMLALLVHSGSRGLGAAVLGQHMPHGAAGIALDQGGAAYLAAHDNAVRFARLNRQVIAQRALQALRVDGRLLCDVPHNLAERQGDCVLHRKGAAPSDRGLVPVPGSRGAFTFLVEPLPSPDGALASIAHGAGRKHDRASMRKFLRKEGGALHRLMRTSFGGHVLCADRRLLVEEAPEAYKDIRKVMADLEVHRMVRTVAVLRPVVTFKTMRENAAGGTR